MSLHQLKTKAIVDHVGRLPPLELMRQHMESNIIKVLVFQNKNLLTVPIRTMDVTEAGTIMLGNITFSTQFQEPT